MPLSFSARVLELTKRIPKGKVSTYGDIAKALGNPKAARAVGNALNKNPHPVTVPCHRVVRSGGAVGGYVSGKKEKIALLKSEGIKIKRGKVADFDNIRWIFRKR
ncbi:MAG: MGMT family protein [Nanoarchaeota archaeon]|nr:MGMT family protein [Nanoarchaeota archaeon]MBU4300540.1 MGMT family protein [Nanoarchaeota archaeon]MBU4451897.1 MGMT family protein [Nanoarchaeota archaeon]MCG2724181.1 MGMT family protein [archaeon]